MECQIDRSFLRKGIIKSVADTVNSSNLFSVEGDTAQILGTPNQQHQNLIDNINNTYQSEVIYPAQNNTYKINPSEDLLSAYEAKYQEEIEAQKSPLFQVKVSPDIPPATKKTLDKVNTFLDRVRVKVETMYEVVVGGKKLGVQGVALPLQSLIVHVTGRDNTVLTEEAMHIGVELLSQKDPSLYNQLEREVVKNPIYQQVLEEYGKLSAYQNKDGSKNVNKLKREAIGKVLTQEAVNKEINIGWWAKVKNFLKKLFQPLKQDIDIFQQAVDVILGEDLGTIRSTLLQSDNYLKELGFDNEQIDRIKKLAESPLTDSELRIAISDIVPEFAFYQTTPEVEIRAERIRSKDGSIVEVEGVTGGAVEGAFKINGKLAKRTATSIALNTLKSKVGTTNPIYNVVKEGLENKENLESIKIAKKTISKVINSEGFYNNDEALQYLSSLRGANEIEIATETVRRLESFRQGTKFLVDTKIEYEGVVAKVDLIAIDPNEVTHILNFQEVSLQEGEVISKPESEAYRAQVQTIRDILQRGYNVSRFGQTRTILFNKIDSQTGDTILEAAWEGNPDKFYLQPIPTYSETVGSDTLDKIVSEMYSIDKRSKAITGAKTLEDIQRNKVLSGLMQSFRALQVRQTVGPVRRQITKLTELIDNLSNQYRENIKNKVTDPKDSKVLSFERNAAIAMEISGNMANFGKGLTEMSEDIDSSGVSSALNNLTGATQRLLKDVREVGDLYIASPVGVREITVPELRGTWLARQFRTASRHQQSSIQAVQKIIAEAQHKTELAQSDFIKEMKSIKDKYTKWARSKGYNKRTMFDPIFQKDAKGNRVVRLVDQIDKSFYEEAKKAIQGKDLSWVKDNIDLKAYQEWFESQRDIEFSNIDALIYSEHPDFSDEEVRDQRKEDWLDRYDLSRGISTLNNKIYSFPIESKFTTKEYNTLTSKGNEPALELYNIVKGINEKASESGIIDEFQAKTWFPQANKSIVDRMLDGKSPNILERFLRNVSSETNQSDFGEYRPDQASKRRIPISLVYDITKKKIDDATGEVISDYTDISTDVFFLIQAYNYEVDSYINKADIDSSIAIIQAIENNKQVRATDRVSGKYSDAGGIEENIENKEDLEKFVLALQYGRTQSDMDLDGQITLNINKTNEWINKKLGTNWRTDYKDTKVSVKEILNATKSYFVFKVLGVNLGSALTNLAGTNLQGFINSGQYFTKKEWAKSTFTLFGKKVGGMFNSKEKTIDLALLDYFNPLVDNEGNVISSQGLKRDFIQRLEMDRLLMGLLRESDKPVQYLVAHNYINNTMVVDGKLVNIRDYLRTQDKYVNMYNLRQAERDKLKKEFEQEVNSLKETKSLRKVATFDSEGSIQIPGIDKMSDTVYKFRDKIQQTSKDATGMGTLSEYRLFNSTILGRNLMTFFSWAPGLIDQRFQGFRYVAGQNRFEQGRVLTLGNFLGNLISSRMSDAIGVLTMNDRGVALLKEEFKKTLEKYEYNTGKTLYSRVGDAEANRKIAEAQFIEMYQRNIKNQLAELGILLGLFGSLLLMIKFGPDDDEELRGLHKFAVKVTRKTLQEISFFYNPMSLLDMTSGKMLPQVQILKDYTRFQKALNTQLFGTEEEKNKVKPLGKALKTLPVFSQVAPIIAMFSEGVAKDLDYELPDPENPPDYNR